MTTLISRPIFGLGSRTLSTASVFRRSRVLYDYALGEIGLLAANSKDYPYQRATAPFKKDQFDNSGNPGEQTLTNWWLRSQASFHYGSGVKFMEPSVTAYVPRSQDESMNGFRKSAGVNPWTPGQLTLLRATSLKKSATGAVQVMGAVDGTTDIYFHAAGTGLSRETAGGTAAVTWGGAGTILGLTNDGQNYYAADSTGVYKGTLAGGTGTLAWNTGNASVAIGWAKQRLVAGIGPSVYELVGGTPPTLPTPLYTHPSSNWTWTSVAEGPSAIFLAGYAGGESAIYKFVLNSSGVMPTLTSGIVACKLPTGETVRSMETYLGTFIAIGTNKGVRIGTIDSNGDISYGPLSIESSSPVLGLVGQDRFIYASCTDQIDGDSGLWRIDLGQEKHDGSFAQATDLQAHVPGAVTGVTLFGASGQLVFGVTDSGSYLESATNLEAQGYLDTGFVRFDTVEPKQFRYISARLKGQGTASISTVDRNEVETGVVTIDETSTQDYDMGRTVPEEYLGLKFTLNQASATVGPTLTSWQLKALPATNRSRLIQVPVLLFEQMRDSKGTALPTIDVHAVLQALEQLENAAQPILFAELNKKPNRTELVVIDQIQYQQTAPPANLAQGNGGVLVLTLRTVL